MTHRKTTLENGLRIVAEPQETAASAAIGFFVRSGARDEPKSLMGVSHFLEHMAFKGSDARSGEEVDRAFDALGVQHNAWTSHEMTAFWTAGLPETLAPCSDILAELLRPALRQEDFDAERGVILEEIAMYDDQPFWVLYERAMEAFWGAHPMGHRVLGTPDSIAAMDRDAMAAYHARRYGAGNTVVAMAGQVDFDAMVQVIDDTCGDWETGETQRDDAVPATNGGDLHVPLDDVRQHYRLCVMPGPDQDDDRRYAAAALAAILGSGDASRLHWALVDTGLAEEAAASCDPHDGTGMQMTWAVCSPEHAKEVADVMTAQMGQLADSVTPDDLARVCSRAATALALGAELSGDRMQRTGRIVAATGRYRSLEEELERIESLSLDDLAEAAEAFPWTACVAATADGGS